MKQKYIFLVVIIFYLILGCIDCCPNIIVVNESHRNVDVNTVLLTVEEIVAKYSNVTGIVLSKPIVVRIRDKVYIGRYVVAYTEEKDKYYQIVTSSTSLHVLAHELFHIFQYERWHRFLDGMAEKYNWFVESMPDAVPIYLFNTSPIIHNSLETYLGFRKTHWFKSSRRDYVLRIFWLKLFEKYGFKSVLQRYFNVCRDDLNPLQQMFNTSEIADILSYFYYDCNIIDNRSIYHYVPRPYIYSFGAICIYSDRNVTLYVNSTYNVYYTINIESKLNATIKYIDKMNNHKGNIPIYIVAEKNFIKIYLINTLNATIFWYTRY